MQYGSYLCCKDHIEEVRNFLGKFFEESKDRYNHSGWITFKTPGGFLINLMRGKGQEMTKNMTFEIYCQSLEELKKYAKKFNQEIQSFNTTESLSPYKYNFIEIYGPQNICKVEISYSEDL